MREEIIKCDICEKILNLNGRNIKGKFGVTWTFGYSKGGWGSRENKPSFSGEVCEECYKVFSDLTEGFNKELLFRRKGINRQKVTIV